MSVVLIILRDKLVEVRQARIVINDVVKEEADDMITIPAVVIMIGDQDLKISIGVDKYNLSRIKDLRQNPLQAKRSCHLGKQKFHKIFSCLFTLKYCLHFLLFTS